MGINIGSPERRGVYRLLGEEEESKLALDVSGTRGMRLSAIRRREL